MIHSYVIINEVLVYVTIEEHSAEVFFLVVCNRNEVVYVTIDDHSAKLFFLINASPGIAAQYNAWEKVI